MQQVALWCLYIGIVCAVCGTVWCGFGVVSVQQVALCYLYIGIVCVCVWDNLEWVWGSEWAAGGFVVFVYRHCVCVCCVWECLEWVWGSECAAGGFVVFVYRHCVCCVWDSLVWV